MITFQKRSRGNVQHQTSHGQRGARLHRCPEKTRIKPRFVDPFQGERPLRSFERPKERAFTEIRHTFVGSSVLVEEMIYFG